MLPLTWAAKVWCLDELREWAPGTLACSPALGGLHPYGLSIRPRDGRCWFAPWPLLCVPSWGRGRAETEERVTRHDSPLSPAKTPGECETCDREEEPTSLAGDSTQSCVSQGEGRVKKKVHRPGPSSPWEPEQPTHAVGPWRGSISRKCLFKLQMPWLGWWWKKRVNWVSNPLTLSQAQECAVNQIILGLEVAVFPVVGARAWIQSRSESGHKISLSSSVN